MTEVQKKALNVVFEKFDAMTDEDLLKKIDSQEALDNDLFVDANRVDYKMENGLAQNLSFSSKGSFSEIVSQFDYSMEKGVSLASGNFSFNDFGLSFAA
ncbi:MAG: hypothetical protein K2I95_10240 [Treponemataceae bacterium]|nr:hypothetical protein [Treponemataceae bacterium]